MIYPYIVSEECVDGHQFWVAKSCSLKGCVGQGENRESAVTELESNEKEWLKTAEAVGIQIPTAL